MTEQEIFQIASAVVSDTKFWIGLVGVIGAIVGSVLTILGNFAFEWFKNRGARKINDSRQAILKEMLESENFQWRNLSTLAAVIGCDEETTKNHLITIGARGSEKNDGKWGLVSKHPISKIGSNYK
jgi:hypothetical protein